MIKSEPLVRANIVHKPTKSVSCLLYRAINGSPESNVTKVVELMGGIEKTIGHDDVVVIKPNVQWWNRGAPNLLALKTEDLTVKSLLRRTAIVEKLHVIQPDGLRLSREIQIYRV